MQKVRKTRTHRSLGDYLFVAIVRMS